MIPSELWANENVRGQEVSDGAIRRLAKRIHPATIRELVLVAEADHLGRGPFEEASLENMLMPPDQYPAREWLLERARELEVEQSKPADLTRGRDWLRLGFEPGKHIGELIKLSNDLRDDKGWSREDVLWMVHAAPTPEQGIEQLRQLLNDKSEQE
jgi:tRNA nucleotidyltransferase (CCA-adding enzyme)